MLKQIKDAKLVDDRPRADDFLDGVGVGVGVEGVVEGDEVVDEVDVVEVEDVALLVASPTAVCNRPGGIPPSMKEAPHELLARFMIS